MLRSRILLSLALLLLLQLLPACTRTEVRQEGAPSAQVQTKGNRPKVIILLADSLLSPSIDRLLQENKLPAIRFLIEHGVYKRDLISAFPTMSVTIDSTMLTGTYPDRHKIPGLLWFHPQERRIVNYGDGQRAVWQLGPEKLLTDSLFYLNQRHLSGDVRTLHEELHRRGRTSASINGLMYRGDLVHRLVFPNELLDWVMGREYIEVKGPNLLGFGALSQVSDASLPAGPRHSYGFHDEYTLQSLIRLATEGRLPDVTFAYFGDMDGRLHKKGPGDLQGVLELEERLERLLDSFGSWERALEQNAIVLVGDSGVSAIGSDKRRAVIDLDQIIGDLGYRNTPLGRTAQPEDDVAIAVNGNMCYLYSLSPRAPLAALAAALQQDARVDLIAWKVNGWVHVQKGGSSQWLRYRPGKSHPDLYGAVWDVEGDWSVLGLKRQGRERRIGSDAYPDGLSRLHSALHSHEGQFLVASAAPGTEFHANRSPNHPGGGNHGSLHREVSLAPLIVAMKDKRMIPPLPARTVEFKAFILSLLEPGR